MKQLLFLLITIRLAVPLCAQNLLANGGFEDRNTCTELRAVCAPEGWFRIPLDAVSNNKGTAGFLLGHHHESVVMENVSRPGIFRSYLYTRLLCPLQKGKEYVFTASFRTPANNEVFRHVDILWLGFEPFHFQDRIKSEKQLISITVQDKTEDLPGGWKTYRQTFIASGEEEYLLIGNLSKGIFPCKPQRGPFIIYDMDNLSVFPTDPSIAACAELENNRNKLYLHNYRHTPGKFLDDEEPPPTQPKKDTPVLVKQTPALIPAPIPVVNDTLVIPDVLFKFNKSELNPVFATRLDSLIDKIKNKTFQRIEVLGHTDSLGKEAYNQQLSISRAETVKKYLIDRLHYAADIILTKGFAATLPVTSNATGAGRQRNRRVEIVLVRW
ncbi:MAG: OmpA family protein [Bacteroidota bacterium]